MANLIESYAHNPIVYSIINKISGVTARAERVLLNQSGEEVENGEIYELLENPNEGQTITDFNEVLYTQLLASGNAFIRLIKGVGMGAELKVLNSKDVEINVSNYGMVNSYSYDEFDVRYTIPAEEILHIKFANIVHTDREAAHYGYSPLEAAMKVVTASNEIFNAEASIFKNRGIVGLLTNETDVPLLPKDRDKLQADFQEVAGGSDKFNKIAITNQKMKYLQMGMSPNDLKLIENQINKLRLLCSVFGIDSKLLGDGANSTYNNVSEAQKNAYYDTYLPLCRKVDTSLIRFLNKEFGEDYEYKVDTTKILAIKEVQTLEDLILEKINLEELSLEELQALQSGNNNHNERV
jgi:HK97 family phage portal protein